MMDLVVERPTPFSKSQLNISNLERWNTLLPLFCPSFTSFSHSDDSLVYLNKDLARNRDRQHVIAVIKHPEAFADLVLRPNLTMVIVRNNLPQLINKSTEEIVSWLARLAETSCQILGEARDDVVEHNFVLDAVIVEEGSTRECSSPPSGCLSIFEVENMPVLSHVVDLLGVALASRGRISSIKFPVVLDGIKSTLVSETSIFEGGREGRLPLVRIDYEKLAAFGSARRSVSRYIEAFIKSVVHMLMGIAFSVHIAGFNGLSKLETLVLAHCAAEKLRQLGFRYLITTSQLSDKTIKGRGWSISMCCISPRHLGPDAEPSSNLETETADAHQKDVVAVSKSLHLEFYDDGVRRRIVKGCQNLIDAEPLITEYDTIVGDADCGYTLRDGAKKVLSFINGKDLRQLPQVLSAMVDELEINMGGTSGALYCIYLSSLAQNLRTSRTVVDALIAAQDHLLTFTRARKGDRTMLDCLIPFIEALKAGLSSEKALAAANEGTESTKTLEAKLGRSVYLNQDTTQGVPDPGAFGLLKLLEGLVEG